MWWWNRYFCGCWCSLFALWVTDVSESTHRRTGLQATQPKRKKILQRDYREINKLYSTIFDWKTFKTKTLNPGKMESDMTSKKEYLIFWKTLFRKTKILFSDWIKMIYYFILLFLYVFTHLPSLSRRESNLVSTSYHPDVIIKYISLSLLRSCFVLR